MSKQLGGPVFVALLALVAWSPAGCQGIGDWLQGKSQSVRQYDTARLLFEKEKYGEAAVAFRTWLADYHDKPDVLTPFVLYQYGECCRRTRDYDRAARAYKKLVDAYVASPNASVQDLVTLGKLWLDDILPGGRLPAETGGSPGAAFSDRFRSKPESIRQYESAVGLFDGEKYAEAAVAFRAWLTDYQSKEDLLRPMALYRLGECYRQMRDYERAAAPYKALVETYSATTNAALRQLVELGEQRLKDIQAAAKGDKGAAGSETREPPRP